MVRVTYYLEVISSWCHWCEPSWAALKDRYTGQADFEWKIALMSADAYPVSVKQCEWFYRRSGSIQRSPYMLNPGWMEADPQAYAIPNRVAQAGKELGVTDDRVRLALSQAAVLQGRKVARWETAAEIAAAAGGLKPDRLLEVAQSDAVLKELQATTQEFDRLQINQRPGFLLQNSIGDRVVLSGLVRLEPLAACIDALLADEEAYVSWKAHFGDPPKD